MKKRTLLWIMGLAACILLLGSFPVKYYAGNAPAADIMRAIGFILLAVFTVLRFRGYNQK